LELDNAVGQRLRFTEQKNIGSGCIRAELSRRIEGVISTTGDQVQGVGIGVAVHAR
jgi:hypothetical protein